MIPRHCRWEDSSSGEGLGSFGQGGQLSAGIEFAGQSERARGSWSGLDLLACRAYTFKMGSYCSEPRQLRPEDKLKEG